MDATDNEIRFVNRYCIYKKSNKLNPIHPDFSQLDNEGKFCNLMSNYVPKTLLWFNEYVCQPFNVKIKKV